MEQAPQQLLAGDIGGTTTRLVLAVRENGAMRVLAERNFESRRYPGLAEVIAEFRRTAATGPIDAACFAVAGPVRHEAGDEAVQVTNLPWAMTRAELVQATGIAHVRLINDFEAIGYRIPQLAVHELCTLQAGVPDPHGPCAILGAGTGLGQAILVRRDNTPRVLPTEGGHVDFGPVDEVQLALAAWLIQHHGRATYERILSGNGLARLYEFLRERGDYKESPTVAAALQQSDPAAAVSEAALTQNDPLASAALDLFVRIYGAQAGNLALATGATGGVYIAGGIAPRILDKLREGAFLAAFCAKGRMTGLVQRIPLHVILQPDIGLRGALACAAYLQSTPNYSDKETT
jgi:glucokinase